MISTDLFTCTISLQHTDGLPQTLGKKVMPALTTESLDQQTRYLKHGVLIDQTGTNWSYWLNFLQARELFFQGHVLKKRPVIGRR